MNINHITHALFSENKQGIKPLELRDGQIVFGKINKLFPHQMAEVQIGSQKMIANLAIPLTVDKQYWFQVNMTQEKPILKVLVEPKENNKMNGESLLNHLSLGETKENRALIQRVITNQLPMTKEMISMSSQWLTNDATLKKDLGTIQLMINRNLPFSFEVFKNLSSVQTKDGITDLLNLLQKALSDSNIKQGELTNVLSDLTNASADFKDGKMSVDNLKQVFQKIGYSYETELVNNLFSKEEILLNKEMIKPLLMELVNSEVPTSIKEVASQVIEKITGYQLLSQPVGPMMQIITEIPIRFLNQQVDVTVQYNGRKKEDGKVDSDYCRILFYLELAHLKETIIDMHVQNRVMSITVQNDQEKKIAPLINSYLEGLKKNLQEANYTLLSIMTKPLTKKTENAKGKYRNMGMDIGLYKGVDIKI